MGRKGSASVPEPSLWHNLAVDQMMLRAAVLGSRRSFPKVDDGDDALGSFVAPRMGRGEGTWGYTFIPPTRSFRLRDTSCRVGAGCGGQRRQVHCCLFLGSGEGMGSSPQNSPRGWIGQADGGHGLWP